MPLKLTRAKSKGPKKILSKIPIGTTFVGDISEYYPNILCLRVHDGLVSLDDPNTTWIGRDEAVFAIENYRPVDIVGEVREI